MTRSKVADTQGQMQYGAAAGPRGSTLQDEYERQPSMFFSVVNGSFRRTTRPFHNPRRVRQPLAPAKADTDSAGIPSELQQKG